MKSLRDYITFVESKQLSEADPANPYMGKSAAELEPQLQSFAAAVSASPNNEEIKKLFGQVSAAYTAAKNGGATPTASAPATNPQAAKIQAEIERFTNGNNMSYQANKDYVAKLQAKLADVGGAAMPTPAPTKTAPPAEVERGRATMTNDPRTVNPSAPAPAPNIEQLTKNAQDAGTRFSAVANPNAKQPPEIIAKFKKDYEDASALLAQAQTGKQIAPAPGGAAMPSTSAPARVAPKPDPTVIELQKKLKEKGANLGTTGPNKDGVDGIMGPKTREAQKQFPDVTTQTDAEKAVGADINKAEKGPTGGAAQPTPTPAAPAGPVNPWTNDPVKAAAWEKLSPQMKEKIGGADPTDKIIISAMADGSGWGRAKGINDANPDGTPKVPAQAPAAQGGAAQPAPVAPEQGGIQQRTMTPQEYEQFYKNAGLTPPTTPGGPATPVDDRYKAGEAAYTQNYNTDGTPKVQPAPAPAPKPAPAVKEPEGKMVGIEPAPRKSLTKESAGYTEDQTLARIIDLARR